MSDESTELIHWENRNGGPVLVVDGHHHILTIPPVTNPESAQLTEDFINHYGMMDRVTQISRSAHIPGSSAPKLLKAYLMGKFTIKLQSEDSITNLFMFLKKRNEMYRTLLASESKDSGFDRVIDSTLLMAFEDISIEYARLSTELRDLNDLDDDDRDPVKVSELTKKLHQLRKEMLRFKEMVRPAEQKVDVKDERQQDAKVNSALDDALKLIKSDTTPKVLKNVS